MGRVVAPWHAALSETQHSLIVYGLVVTGLALLAMLVRVLVSQREVSGRYRPAVAASLGVLSVAALSYAALLLAFLTGYRWTGAVWAPGQGAVGAWSFRYMDWSVTVPLLVVELIAVSSLSGALVARTRMAGITAAFLMIATGYIGGVAVDDGGDRTALLVWGLVSTVFFVLLYGLVLLTVVRSLPALPSAARPAYRTAMVVLMVTWFVYPVVFGLQGVTTGGAWATTGQLLLCAADVVAKVGFGHLVLRVAKLRTAFDVQLGLDTHPETLWVDGGRVSEALTPPVAEASPLRDEVLVPVRSIDPRIGG